MIFDIFEQEDLFAIAGCGQKVALERWLNTHRIPYLITANHKIIAHRKAVEQRLGVIPEQTKEPQPVKLNLGGVSHDSSKARKRKPRPAKAVG